MSKKAVPRRAPSESSLIAELRAAIRDDERTSYALAKEAGVDESAIRRFISRERSISLETADLLMISLGLKVVRTARAKKIASSVDV